MNNKPTPRINSKLREKYVGTTVRISGKVISVSTVKIDKRALFNRVCAQFAGDTAVIEATDHGQVLVKLNGVSRLDNLKRDCDIDILSRNHNGARTMLK